MLMLAGQILAHKCQSMQIHRKLNAVYTKAIQARAV